MSAKKFKKKPNVPKTRKQLRKEQRKNKKIRKHEYYTNRRKPGKFVLAKKNPEDVEEPREPPPTKKVEIKKQNTKSVVEDSRDKEKKQQQKLQKEMSKQRNKQLLKANLDEDRNIKQLEKQLKLNKRKTKAVPASFSRDGLDYLLEVCDPENLKSSALAEQQLAAVNDEFEEDLALMTGSGAKRRRKDSSDGGEISGGEEEGDVSGGEEEGESSDGEAANSEEEELGNEGEAEASDEGESSDGEAASGEEDELGNEGEAEASDEGEGESIDGGEVTGEDEDEEEETIDQVEESSEDEKKRKRLDSSEDGEETSTPSGTWEDIYGRLRAPDGSIVNSKTDKYIPPAARLTLDPASTDKVRAQKLERLKKQLKGLINRLAESNMHSIATQIEELYMNNSRNDMNSTITNLILEALVSRILAPERLLMEHVLLITVLHANVGTEVGAHFLERVAKLFEEYLNNAEADDKKLDNVVIILAQLYNFKLFDSKLVYEILEKLAEKFEEKEVECILHILRNVGFNLRKDDPLALKNLILGLQKRASGASAEMKDNSRVKFMLDVLLAIKNNNVSKIPNYDTSYSEHLKKIMKGFIRKGNYVSQLNISLQDLVKVEEKGKWWVVGSAWSGKTEENTTPENSSVKSNKFSRKLLDLATKQRMNTDTRKNIFCIIMSAEDYLDAFEKLLRLGLKTQQEREIIHVILHCCLQEKVYNPYYATLAQKFCEHDRKHQMTIKYSIWDKLKTLNDHSTTQISHLAKVLGHLFIEKGLPISTLKIIQFSELDKVTLRFIRQILLRILLDDDLEVCKGVFEKVCQSDKLKMFRESLRLFLHHFLLRNLDSQGIEAEKKELVRQRVKVVEKLLAGKETKLRY